eukprot:CAMPEP_0206145770 /NCGR_PEP_ID=MMETSP1473-20131121/28474_1 /ASSEMBLY_ACC=CAM_ASM_001109 /TAXON_ID=1461547 /ORGANISM="Stichococcus sp, Strain RCC1054" /LENGTH=238 /DNA_ID=CAMNT_0053542107 /DNA_START=219 /DNA_END=935 /DNA_ORIENTATION=+
MPPGTKLEASQEVLELLRTAQGFAFDVDSTLCEDESIDELAAYLGSGEAVAALTKSAMGGTMTFQEALEGRLSLMNVSRSQVAAFLADHPPRLSKGIPELVRALQRRGQHVFLVSGGFRVIINPIAEMLGIPLDNVYANTILHQDDADGNYAGFDTAEFTSQSGGKAAAVRHIKAKHGLDTMVMVGDGATDLEARQPGGADLFIGYGGTVARDNVAAGADWFVYDIHQVLNALEGGSR